jgi:hypothetical protein
MSTANNRYYNSPAGVGIVLATREEGEFTYVAGRAKNTMSPTPWVKTAQLYLSSEEANGQPVARFMAHKPNVQKVDESGLGF